MKKTQSCYFCKGSNHCVTNCPLKDSYGVSKDGSELVKFLKTSCPYTILSDSEKQTIISTDVSCQTGIKHVIVLSFIPKSPITQAIYGQQKIAINDVKFNYKQLK